MVADLMAPAAIPRADDNAESNAPRPRRVCFSFAAYAKTLIDRISSSNIVVVEGLSDSEFSAVESSFNFCFPPDLRYILQQGLPLSPGFPNWRSSSPQQLEVLLNLPVLSLLRRVSRNNFWHPTWGPRPQDKNRALDTARLFLRDAPVLVPIYRHWYIASSPNLAGNPVFYVDHEGEVRVASYDVVGFFREAEFVSEKGELNEPAWAATRERKIEFWSAVADGGEYRRRGWWWKCMRGELGECLEGVYWRLKDGGWREEEIREMMKGGEEKEEEEDEEEGRGGSGSGRVTLRILSLTLLRGGWSREDVVHTLGVIVDEGMNSCL